MATVLQHLVREEKEIAFVGAGLPSAVSAMLNDDVLTFLRRADRHSLGPVGFGDVAVAITEPIERAQRQLSGALAARAAEATGGYPFLIQLIGYHILAPASSPQGDQRNRRGRRDRRGEKTPGIARPRASHCRPPGVARTFLPAMAHDDGPSKMSDIANRLRVDANYAGQYRLRLIATELVVDGG